MFQGGGVSFFTDAWGVSYLPNQTPANKYLYNRSNGSYAGSVPAGGARGFHNRAGASNNPRHFISGTLTPWRNASAYKRQAYLFKAVGIGDYNVSGAWYAKDAVLYPSDITLGYTALGNNRCPFFTGLSPDANSSSFDVNNCIKAATVKALNDLGSKKANIGEALGESLKTARSLAETTWSLAKLGIALKKGNIWPAIKALNARKLKRLLRSKKLLHGGSAVSHEAAKAWLSYFYAYRPLALDAYGLYELLQEQLQPALLVHGRGQSGLSWSIANVRGDPGTYDTPAYRFTEQSEFSVRCGMTGRITEDYLRTINRVGLANPVSLAWELLPFSMLVDWVLPIGDVLEALTAPAGLQFQGGFTTVRSKRHIDVSVDGPDLRKGDPKSQFGSICFDRKALVAFPRPKFFIKSPFISLERGGWERITSALSLLVVLKAK